MSAAAFDVVVIGGGPAGSAASILLATRGRRVALLESTHYDEPRLGETFPPEIALPLRELDLFQGFTRAGHLPSSGIVASWASETAHRHDFLFNPYGPGWHVDRRRFDLFLAKRAQQLGCDLLMGTRATTCRREGGLWRLKLQAGGNSREIEAGSLICATGRGPSPLRAWMGRPVFHHHLVAFFSRVSRTGRLPGGDCTVIEAVHDGWWYSAPLPDSLAIFAFLSTAAIPRKEAAWWHCQLASTELTKDRYAACSANRPVEITSANSFHSPHVAGTQWAAAGDAAFCRDPLSSQGVYCALRSGMASAGTLLSEQSPETYANTQALEYAEYLTHWQRFYLQVERFAQYPFWARVSFLATPPPTFTS
jgi:flavin-dependent dehydrogenase